MKVAIIGIAGLPPRYGGFETLADNIVRHLGNEFSFYVYCSSLLYKEKKLEYHGASLIYIPLKANGFMSIFYDIISCLHSLRYADALLILGVSGTVILPVIRVFSSKPILVHIDGCEWRREKWNWFARRFLKFSEKIAVKFATRTITDNPVIKQYVKETYDVDSLLIEYGGDHAFYVSPEEYSGEFPFIRDRYACAVCRIEPENNVHIILEAFEDIKDIPLVIIGNWHNTMYGRDLKKRYGSLNHIHLWDAIYDGRKLNAIRSNCYIYVHGHSAGGTNPSLVEAMNLGLPIIAYDVPYNRATTEDKALYFKTPDDLATIVKNISGPRREEISKAMKEISQNRYTWHLICNKLAHALKNACY